MDMEGLHSFITVAREKSISKAAQILHLTQPTLSSRLRKLEEGLGVKLLYRSWDGIKLTNEGRFFLSYSVQLLQELEEAATLLKVHGDPDGGPIAAVTSDQRLHIGVETFFNPAFLEAIIQVIREVSPNLECHFVTKSSETLCNLTEYEGLHITVHFDSRECPGSISLPAIEDDLVLLYPLSGYPEIHEDLSNVKLLEHRPFILYESSPLLRYREVTERILMNMFGSVPRSYHIVSDTQTMTAILESGFGYTFTTVSSILHLLEKPLPFNLILMKTDYISKLNIQVSYSTAASAMHHPIEKIAGQIQKALQNKYSSLHTKLSGS
ncbi:LysR family transcriptional regulator [Paenibacillus physcomitrellae]|uniref:HTH lysR-type domain-containing protein n=1 Tax=Paenibacillus physcomitrellae TaxID=1619311 RepID=A0ABQ1GCJ1_9BACL|nr:LysR family transcriptional regulator [Paenibacillus physcomitrellae]GGA41099.1 hypothetical protein GCM10010917_27950 [Paenibacillus physcomitrellae]